LQAWLLSHHKAILLLDDRTFEICRALAAQNKFYPLKDAVDTMKNLISIDTQKQSLESVREMNKEMAPWVSDKQIERNSSGNPIGVSGNHALFQPFHWKCRTTTEIEY